MDHFKQLHFNILTCLILSTYWLLRKKMHNVYDFKKTFILNKHISVSKELYRKIHLQRRKIRLFCLKKKISKIFILIPWKISLWFSKAFGETNVFHSNNPRKRLWIYFSKDIVTAYISDNLKFTFWKTSGAECFKIMMLMGKERLRICQIGREQGDLKIRSWTTKNNLSETTKETWLSL